jgi:hypothetical protein
MLWGTNFTDWWRTRSSAGVEHERSTAMSEEIEVPRRGYDTKDVEAMARALEAAEGGGSRKTVVLLLFCAAIGAAIWLIAGF